VSKHANPTAIGAFVLGALALVVLALVVLGSGRLFEQSYPFVLYFEGNVNGLNVGAPVKFKGVEIGSVISILMRFDQNPEDIHIPVFIAIDARKMASAGVAPNFEDEAMKAAIARGLRARLESQSLLTGLLFVQLDFHPSTPAHFVGSGDKVQEIPTLPTAIEEAQSALKSAIARLDKVDITGLIDEAKGAAASANELLSSDQTRDAVASLDAALKSFQRLSVTLDTEVRPVAQSLQGTSRRADATAAEIEKAAQSVRTLLAPDSPLAVRLVQTLEDVSAAAQAIRRLADTLERDPSALVRGREMEAKAP
jgi:paraquat-inducible protein B